MRARINFFELFGQFIKKNLALRAQPQGGNRFIIRARCYRMDKTSYAETPPPSHKPTFPCTLQRRVHILCCSCAAVSIESEVAHQSQSKLRLKIFGAGGLVTKIFDCGWPRGARRKKITRRTAVRTFSQKVGCCPESPVRPPKIGVSFIV